MHPFIEKIQERFSELTKNYLVNAAQDTSKSYFKRREPSSKEDTSKSYKWKKISKKTDILGRPAKYFWTVIRIYDSCFLPSKKQTKSKKPKTKAESEIYFLAEIDVYFPHRIYQVTLHESPWFISTYGTELGHRNFFCLHDCNNSSLTQAKLIIFLKLLRWLAMTYLDSSMATSPDSRTSGSEEVWAWSFIHIS